MDLQMLHATARELVAPGKGILASDESTGTITKRFKAVGVESTETTRRDWREVLFGTAGIGEEISGAILFDETIRQQASDGQSLVSLLQSQGVIPGIKVDAGAKPLALAAGQEKVTEGLDGLRERLSEYVSLGARFTKWRAVLTIGAGIPSRACIRANAHALGRFAALSQEAGLVPIVEPEVLMDGAHDIQRCFDVTEMTQHAVMEELYAQSVAFEGMLLKPNMVLSGKDAPEPAGAERVAEMTVRCLRRTVPAAVPGVVFLSGGQSDEQATVNLDAINRIAAETPWELSFSYGRGLQTTPMAVWQGRAENVEAARAAFRERARLTSAARQGAYSGAAA